MKKQILLSFLVLFTPNLNAQKTYQTEWLFIYYMPYDNNLSYLGNSIIQMIKSGIKSNKVIASVQSDFRDNLGMKRYIITADTIFKDSIPQENSGDTKSFSNYLDWVNQKVDTKHKVAIFLDHGGKLDGLGLDEKPNYKFMRVDSIKTTLKEYNYQTKTKLDLLFLQVCTKGSIEPLYEFKDCANYTLCSQTDLGAPNYYYTKLFEFLSYQPDASIEQIAELIVKYEGQDMYSSYTCVKNSEFEQFKELFQAFLNFIKASNMLKFDKYKIKHLFYGGEDYFDLSSWLHSLLPDDNKMINLKNDLIKFIEEKLIFFHKINVEHRKMDGYCGMSLLALNEDFPELFESYQYMQFFKDFDLINVYKKLQKK